MRRLLVFIFCCYLFSDPVAAQQQETKKSFNQTDKNGKRDGMWLIQQPAGMGEDASSEFGTYLAGRKSGLWYRMDANGEVAAIEHFKKDVRDGEVKYFEQGHLICIGNYRGLNPDQQYDTIFVMDPVTQYEKLVRIATDRGSVKHGLWKYYDAETGRLMREDEYQADELIARKEFTIAHTDSAYYRQRTAQMPHNQKFYYKPPAAKRYKY